MTVAQLVGRERARLGLAIIARGIAVALALGAVVIAAGTIALGDARWITRPGGPLVAWAVALAVAIVVLRVTRRDVRRAASSNAIAREIERERALRAGSLRGALEVADSGALGRHAAEMLGAHLRGAALAPSVRRRALRHDGIAVLGAITGIAILGAARDSAPDGWRALKHPLGAFTGSILAPLRIIDAPRYVMRGEKLTLRVSAPDRRSLALHIRTTGAPWDTLPLPVAHGTAATVLGPLDADVKIVATDGRMSTDTLLIRVTDRPFVGDVAIRATYPAYLGRPAETIPLGEPARVPRGTLLAISGRASTELARVALVGERDTLHLAAEGRAFAGRLVATESGRWRWLAASGQGPIPDLPSPLELEVIPDSAPRVEILAPDHDTTVLADAQVLLRAEAADDHELSSITLRTRRQLADGSVMPPVTQSLATPHAPQWDGEQLLDLAPRGLEPGDELRIAVAATDNSPWRQTTESREIVLRVPTLTEQRERARAMGDSTVSRIAAAAKSERDLAERTSEAARSRMDRVQQTNTGSQTSSEQDQEAQRHSVSFQSAEQARELAREQQQLQERVQQAQRDAQALEQQLRAAGVLDSSLTQQLRQVQQLLRDALTPELQRQLADVMKAAQQLAPEDLRRAMQNLAEQQKRLREELERSAEMLRRAALEGSMQTLHDEARDIAQQERAMADSLAQRGRSRDSSTARNAQALSQRSRALSQDVADLAKRLEQEKAASGLRKLSGASERADSSASAMQQVAQQNGAEQQNSGTQQSANNQAQNAGNQAQSAADASAAAQQMEQAAQQLGDARQSQIQEWKTQVTSELDQSIQETMQLARDQQRLADRARTGKSNGLPADQSAIQQGVQKVQQRLEQAAQQSAHVSPQSQSALADAAHRVQEATQEAAQQAAQASPRGGQQTASTMDDAAQALNRAAAQMMQDRVRASSASSASGFAEMIEEMRKAAQQQGAINGQTAALIPLPGGQPTPQMIAQARALAQQQRSIADRVENAGNGTGSAEELAKEMRQIADALDRGRLDPQLLQREQHLFHRLLDAGLTLEKDEREDTGKRESRVGADTAIIVRDGAMSGRSAVRYREPTWNELRGLTADERRAVLEYFRRINADQQP